MGRQYVLSLVPRPVYKRSQALAFRARHYRSNLRCLLERIAPNQLCRCLFEMLQNLGVAGCVNNRTAIGSAALAGESKCRFGNLLRSVCEITISPYYRRIVSPQLS